MLKVGQFRHIFEIIFAGASYLYHAKKKSAFMSPNALTGAVFYALPEAGRYVQNTVFRRCKWTMRPGSIFSTFLLSTALLLTGARQANCSESEDIRGLENLVHQSKWLLDAEGRLSAAEVWPGRSEGFISFSELPEKMPRGAALWAVINPKDIEIEPGDRYWYADPIYDHFQVFRYGGGSVQDSFAAGSLVAHRLLPHGDNFMALPFIAAGDTTEAYLFLFYNAGLRRLKVKEISLMSEAEEARVRAALHQSRMARDIYYYTFLGITFFLLVKFLIEWSVKRLPSLIFYCLYLATCGLYYLRILENSQFAFRPLFKHLGQGQHAVEVIIAFSSYSFYMAFVSQFLDLPRHMPRLARFLHWGAFLFVVAIPVMWLIDVFVATTLMKLIFLYVRIAFFLLSFYIIRLLWKKHWSYPMTKFIVVGTSFLVLGMVMTLLPEMFGGELRKDILGGAFGWYVNAAQTIHIPVYDFKFGVLIELVIFSTGLVNRESLLAQYFTVAEAALPADREPATTARYPFPINSDFMKTAVEQVEKNISDEDFRVEELAKAMNMSRESLYIRIKREANLDPTRFLRTTRLWNGRRMIEQTELSIAEVAYAVGFRHPYYFTRTFKDEFGILPSELRRNKSA